MCGLGKAYIVGCQLYLKGRYQGWSVLGFYMNYEVQVWSYILNVRPFSFKFRESFQK
jgi:hypothetical protein